MINYSGRLSKLGGTVNSVDRRRSSLSRSEHPPFSSSVDNTFRRSHFGTTFQREVPLFCRYLNFLPTQCRIGRKKPIHAKNQLDPSIHFDRTSTCERHRHIRAIVSTRASIRNKLAVDRRRLAGRYCQVS